jgi:hypothetical protein
LRKARRGTGLVAGGFVHLGEQFVQRPDARVVRDELLEFLARNAAFPVKRLKGNQCECRPDLARRECDRLPEAAFGFRERFQLDEQVAALDPGGSVVRSERGDFAQGGFGRGVVADAEFEVGNKVRPASLAWLELAQGGERPAGLGGEAVGKIERGEPRERTGGLAPRANGGFLGLETVVEFRGPAAHVRSR